MLHLFHPPLVHFTVAFLVAGAACEAYGLLARRERLRAVGSVLVIAGTISLAPTMFAGYVAANSIDVPARALPELGRHELGGWLVAGAFVAALVWKAWRRGVLPERQRAPYAALLLLGLGLVAWTALAGGKMVFLHGVGVAGGSAPAQHRLQRVSGDLRVLAQPAHRIGVPLLAERHVDA